MVDGKNLRMATALTPVQSFSMVSYGSTMTGWILTEFSGVKKKSGTPGFQMRGFLISGGSWNRQTWGSETAPGYGTWTIYRCFMIDDLPTI